MAELGGIFKYSSFKEFWMRCARVKIANYTLIRYTPKSDQHSLSWWIDVAYMKEKWYLTITMDGASIDITTYGMIKNIISDYPAPSKLIVYLNSFPIKDSKYFELKEKDIGPFEFLGECPLEIPKGFYKSFSDIKKYLFEIEPPGQPQIPMSEKRFQEIEKRAKEKEKELAEISNKWAELQYATKQDYPRICKEINELHEKYGF
eukprot:TRINITY_DN4025_c0_g1_i2.p1 TRINITY_DN4025_c0_g1~~TRINITY_DN4025_c0_g1_i2.p1  ORF type:complete len:204 (+),score=15.46 TRINITY_DN4025_c0_g1_i2:425-1036(+)